MKILVCLDGSKHSQKALEMAAKIGESCKDKEASIIYVYDRSPDNHLPFYGYNGGSFSKEQVSNIKNIIEKDKKEKKKILSDASKFLKERGIKANTIFKEGHPSNTIVNVAYKEGFDMIIIGSRGLSGLKKVFLGSVSNAVVQEVKDCSVLIVK